MLKRSSRLLQKKLSQQETYLSTNPVVVFTQANFPIDSQVLPPPSQVSEAGSQALRLHSGFTYCACVLRFVDGGRWGELLDEFAVENSSGSGSGYLSKSDNRSRRKVPNVVGGVGSK